MENDEPWWKHPDFPISRGSFRDGIGKENCASSQYKILASFSAGELFIKTHTYRQYLDHIMIRLRNLSVSYGDIQALDDISLEISKGEFVLVSGPTGCGKSTLAMVIAGLIPHAIEARVDGEIEILGQSTYQQSLPELTQSIGVVFQNPVTQLFHLRVDQEIAFGPRNLGLNEDEVVHRVDWALEATGIEELREAKPSDLSRGQKQRVAIACALAMRPSILVLDEPTASLDVLGMHLVMKTLEDLHKRLGMTIVLVEHRLADVARLARRVILLEAGKIYKDGKARQVLADRRVRDRLGLRRPTTTPLSRWNRLIEANGHIEHSEPPLVTFEHVSVGYGKKPVLKNISCEFYQGEFTALVGQNGAGKSTFGLVAASLLKPWQGKVRFNHQRSRPGLDVAMLFQNPVDQLFTDSVDEELGFAPRNFNRFDLDQHLQVLTEADLMDLRYRRPLSLSVGQQQRTALAACLTLRPKLVILDEPTLGQDWGHLQRMMDYLTSLTHLGTAILLISHDFKLVHHYAHRILLIKDGSIVADGRLRKPSMNG